MKEHLSKFVKKWIIPCWIKSGGHESQEFDFVVFKVYPLVAWVKFMRERVVFVLIGYNHNKNNPATKKGSIRGILNKKRQQKYQEKVNKRENFDRPLSPKGCRATVKRSSYLNSTWRYSCKKQWENVEKCQIISNIQSKSQLKK